MDQPEVTFWRGLKVWWSFAWRTTVLFVLIVVPIEIAIFYVMKPYLPVAGPNTAPNPQAVVKFGKLMMIVWPLVMALVIALQALAMRWMLRKARWSDFRIAILRRDAE